MHELEAKADAALHAGDLRTFMATFDEMAEQQAVWSPGFAGRTASLVSAAAPEFWRWADRIARGLLQGDEDELRLALEMRSQLELARDVYRSTEAMPTLDSLWDDESDNELRERAEWVGLYGCDYLPISHRWWKGFMPALGKPAPR